MMLEVGLRSGFVRMITLDVLPFIMIIYYFYMILLYDYIGSLPMNDVAWYCWAPSDMAAAWLNSLAICIH